MAQTKFVIHFSMPLWFADCLYGDRLAWCSRIGKRYSVVSCYSHEFECCGTCERLARIDIKGRAIKHALKFQGDSTAISEKKRHGSTVTVVYTIECAMWYLVSQGIPNVVMVFVFPMIYIKMIV